MFPSMKENQWTDWQASKGLSTPDAAETVKCEIATIRAMRCGARDISKWTQYWMDDYDERTSNPPR